MDPETRRLIAVLLSAAIWDQRHGMIGQAGSALNALKAHLRLSGFENANQIEMILAATKDAT